ncbi:ATP synthase subunit I [Macrococcus armenti]|uniref:ATP synthase subunit I n=1 Tax=Macrococcus armenti TaxID=2875764 RepID=UPI001CCC1915|nr:ATP synthase subunit I [Macrococcus armenti]UBH08397.1 ATP synthase subunit I [Macrococcus armenti]UBH10684.1 ATP synthase subunit I [Macrococcus armenti]UBH15165.1 ATP synthase subunit I [Macrococcus armenti]UBH17526.1 ATP synthase subunit I [Macrococcus armenti]UBH19790.1 ATP synthase subunit I [Macrococcus armenti]
MSEFKTFFNLYLKYFLCLIILLAIVYIFYRNSFVLGLIIGTIASAISSFVWHHNLLRAINSDALYVSSGMGIRFLIAIMACLFWVRYPDTFNILGIALGLMLTYVMIIIHGVNSLKK